MPLLIEKKISYQNIEELACKNQENHAYEENWNKLITDGHLYQSHTGSVNFWYATLSSRDETLQRR